MNWILKNQITRKLFLKLELKKSILKSVLLYNKGKFCYKLYYDHILKKIINKSSISRVRNYCIILRNTRSIFRKFKLSRHKIKLFAANGYLIGLKKSSF